MRNEHGGVIYYMIFATDHAVGTKIMSNLYAQAAAEFPAMRAEARQLRQQKAEKDHGVLSLFGDWQPEAAPQKGERFYEHEPPWRPWFLAE